MELKEFIDRYRSETGLCLRPKVFCKDGFNVSIQGSEWHYSTPRKNVKKYKAMELGYPSKKEPLILKYADDKKQPTSTVYAFVPMEVIEKVIKKHKGFDYERTVKEAKKFNFEHSL